MDENGTISKKRSRSSKGKNLHAFENGNASTKGVAAGMIATDNKVNAAIGLGGAGSGSGAGLGSAGLGGVGMIAAAADLQGLVASAEAYENESAAASLKRKREDSELEGGEVSVEI